MAKKVKEKRKIMKVGNSYAVTIPKWAFEMLGWNEDTEIIAVIDLVKNEIILK